jgi:hypothetical protein
MQQPNLARAVGEKGFHHLGGPTLSIRPTRDVLYATLVAGLDCWAVCLAYAGL